MYTNTTNWAFLSVCVCIFITCCLLIDLDVGDLDIGGFYDYLTMMQVQQYILYYISHSL